MTSLAEGDAVLPASLVATHVYSVASLSPTLFKTRGLPSPTTLVPTTQDMSGAGVPEAIQEKVAIDPSSTVAPAGAVVTVGSTIIGKERNSGL